MHSSKLHHFIGLTLITILFIVLFTYCGSKNTSDKITKSEESPLNPTTNSAEYLKNTNTLTVIPSLEPFVKLSLSKYSASTKENLTPIELNSTIGLNQLISSLSSIFISDVYAYDVLSPELTYELTDTKLSAQGFCIVTHQEVPISNLSQQAVIDIFTGRITNWKHFTGTDLPIVLVAHPHDSGERVIFKKYALNGFKENEKKAVLCKDALEVKKAVSETLGAISYLPLGLIQDDSGIKKIRFDDVEPINENIKTGKYPLWYYVHIFTGENLSPEQSKFLDFMKSESSYSIIKEAGHIPIHEMQVSR